MEAPSSSEMLGRYSMGNATALISEPQQVISYQVVAELCNLNGFHFNGFSLLIINEIQKEQVCTQQQNSNLLLCFIILQCN